MCVLNVDLCGWFALLIVGPTYDVEAREFSMLIDVVDGSCCCNREVTEGVVGECVRIRVKW